MLLKHRQTGQRFYRKAPVKFLLQQAQSLRKFAAWSLFFAVLFAVLSNPFAVYESLINLPKQAKLWPEQAKALVESVPEFARALPQEAEKNTFAVFDWTKAQLEGGWPVFAKEAKLDDKEAGQSAVIAGKTAKDYAERPFYIEIPSLEIYEKVQANVNPNDAKEYVAALSDGVAHARGSAFPGQDKLVYIFGHSTDGAWNVEAYNAIFYRIKELAVGEQIILHLGEEKFVYVVSEQSVVKSSDVDFVNDLQGEDLLLLQTCWPPGTTWQRLFIKAVPQALSEQQKTTH